MEKKLAELKADEVSDLKRYVFFTVETINFAFCKIVPSNLNVIFFSQKEEEEAFEGTEEKERKGGAQDGPSRSLHCRQQRHIHVFPQHHQKGPGKKS